VTYDFTAIELAASHMTNKPYCHYSSTGWPDDALDSVQQALAEYHGDNVPKALIERLDGYDRPATAILELAFGGPVFVADGTAYQWSPELKVWQAFDAAPELGDALTDPLVFLAATARGGRRTRKQGNKRQWWRRSPR
jgi:hypothetical protein